MGRPCKSVSHKRRNRQGETKEAKNARLAKNSKRNTDKRHSETQEAHPHQLRLSRMHEYAHSRLSQETPSERGHQMNSIYN